MARFNEVLTGRHNKFLNKLFGIKGAAPSPQVAGDITPSIAFFSGAENRWLESWDRFGTSISIPLNIGQTAGFRFRNPATSNVIAVIEKLSFGCLDQGQEFDVSVGASLADLTTFAGVTLDPRSRPQPSMVASQSNASPSPLAVVIGRPFLLLGTTYDQIWSDNQEIPVLPGQGIAVNSTVANHTITVSVLWRERLLEESERA